MCKRLNAYNNVNILEDAVKTQWNIKNCFLCFGLFWLVLSDPASHTVYPFVCKRGARGVFFWQLTRWQPLVNIWPSADCVNLCAAEKSSSCRRCEWSSGSAATKTAISCGTTKRKLAASMILETYSTHYELLEQKCQSCQSDWFTTVMSKPSLFSLIHPKLFKLIFPKRNKKEACRFWDLWLLIQSSQFSQHDHRCWLIKHWLLPHILVYNAYPSNTRYKLFCFFMHTLTEAERCSETH